MECYSEKGCRTPAPGIHTPLKAGFFWTPIFLLILRCNGFPPHQPMADGLQRWPSSMATRPQPPQTYFMAPSLSLHIWPVSTLGVPQKLQPDVSPQGLHKCPGSSATAPQFLQVYAMVLLLVLCNNRWFSPYPSL